jgi:VanZ family protein
MAFALYASLIPFDLQWAPFDVTADRFRALMLAPPAQRISRTNFLANVLLFVPIGFGLAGAVLADGPKRVLSAFGAAGILALSLLTSVSAEFLQLYAPGRVTARADIVAQTLGCIAGMTVWMAAGPEITRWIRTASRPTRVDRLARGLMGYAVAWAFVNLAPFDVTVDVGEIGRRMRAGLITLVPFGTSRPLPAMVWDALVAMISAMPLGVLGLVGGTDGGTRRTALHAVGLGVGLVTTIEIAQIVIRSHAADVTDALCGAFGVATGAIAGRRLLHRAIKASPSHAVSAWGMGALLAWCGVICAYHWLPFDFALDPEAVRGKLARVSLVPFAGYRTGSDLNALNNLLEKIGVAAPLGLIAAMSLRHWTARLRWQLGCWTAIAIALFGTIETGQLFVPTRTPDPTDVLVGVTASLGGFATGRWLLGGATSPITAQSAD